MSADFYSIENLYRQNLSFDERKEEYDKYSLDDQDSYGKTLFHMAVMYGDSQILEYLVFKGKIEERTRLFKNDNEDRTPFFMLNKIKNPENRYEDIKKIMEILIENKCNLNKRDSSGKLFYHECADSQKYMIFEIMNELGISYDKVILSDGFNVLHIACASTHRIDYLVKDEERYREEEEPYLRTIKAILKSGIDPEIKTAIGRYAYDLVLDGKNKRACGLVKGVDEDDRSYGISIHDACWRGYFDVVEYLVKNGVDVNEFYEGNNSEFLKMSPLAIASKHLHGDIVKFLIKNGADVCLRNGETGYSAFYYFAKTLINNRVNIKGAIKVESFKNITKAFLSDEKFLNSFVDDESHTPINFICTISHRFNWVEESKGEYIIFEILIDRGADIMIADKYGNTPLYNLFKNGGDKIGDMTELLMEYGADINYKNIDGNTPLMLLAELRDENQSIEALEILEQYDFDKTITNNKGETALDIALNKGNEKFAEYLLKL